MLTNDGDASASTGRITIKSITVIMEINFTTLFYLFLRLAPFVLVCFFSLLSIFNFDLKGSSNYAFPLILKKPSFKNRDILEKLLLHKKIEFRRGNAGGGNQLRQPYLKNYIKNVNIKNFKEVDHIHFFGYYIGNYPSLEKNKIAKICKILNSIDLNIK